MTLGVSLLYLKNTVGKQKQNHFPTLSSSVVVWYYRPLNWSGTDVCWLTGDLSIDPLTLTRS